MRDNAGAGIGFFVLFVALGGCVVLLLLVSGIQDNETSRLRAAGEREMARGRAQALVLQAQGQARIDTAQAQAILGMAALPWGVLGLLGCFGFALSLVALSLIGVVGLKILSSPAVPQIARHEVFFIVAPGMPRREVWQMMIGQRVEDRR